MEKTRRVRTFRLILKKAMLDNQCVHNSMGWITPDFKFLKLPEQKNNVNWGITHGESIEQYLSSELYARKFEQDNSLYGVLDDDGKNYRKAVTYNDWDKSKDREKWVKVSNGSDYSTEIDLFNPNNEDAIRILKMMAKIHINCLNNVSWAFFPDAPFFITSGGKTKNMDATEFYDLVESLDAEGRSLSNLYYKALYDHGYIEDDERHMIALDEEKEAFVALDEKKEDYKEI